MRYAALLLFLCLPGCVVAEAVASWFASSDGAGQAVEGGLKILSGNYIEGALQVLGALGIGYGTWRGRKLPRAMMERRRRNREGRQVLDRIEEDRANGGASPA